MSHLPFYTKSLNRTGGFTTRPLRVITGAPTVLIIPAGDDDTVEDGIPDADDGVADDVLESSNGGTQTGGSSLDLIKCRRFRLSVEPSSVSTKYERGESCLDMT